jgi:hypothetical protein
MYDNLSTNKDTTIYFRGARVIQISAKDILYNSAIIITFI